MVIEANPQAPENRRPTRRQIVFGWCAVALNLSVALMWAVWGTIEAYHEGWFHRSVWVNVGWVLLYTSPVWASIALGLLAIRWRKWGSVLYLLTWGGAGVFILSKLLPGSRGFQDIAISLLMGGFGGLVGICFWFGRPRPLRLATWLTAGLPILTFFGLSVEPLSRIATRFDDGDRGTRIHAGLMWAPRGPGWPVKGGYSWDRAASICDRLSEDGTKLLPTKQGLWRLPSVSEMASAMTRGGKSAGGVWDTRRRTANYDRTPDKEAPIWDPYSEVIYLWTATETGTDSAYRVVYHGGVFDIPKHVAMGTQGFRAVRTLPAAFKRGEGTRTQTGP